MRGQSGGATDADNGCGKLPGFPEGVKGPDLMTNMRKQAERFGVKVVGEDVAEVDFTRRPFEVSAQGRPCAVGR